MAKMRTFFAAMWPTFFIRVRPASRNAKPACMKITSTAVTTTQIVLAAYISSLLVIARSFRRSGHRPVLRWVPLRTRSYELDLLEWETGAVVGDAGNERRPADAVAVGVP